MYSDTITLFNRYHSKLGDMWYPHILKGVNLISDKASIMAKYGAETSDKASLHIKYKEVDGKIKIDGIPFLPPKEWASLTNDELGKYITFNDDANRFDFFIVGEYDGGPVFDDGSDVKGFYEKMDAEHDYCYVITSVSSPYKVIPHFEIMAR